MIAMTAVSTEASYKSRLPLKLFLLFFGTFLAVVIGGLVLDVFASLVEDQQNQAQVAAQQSPVVIDSKLESELAKVMSFDNSQVSADLKDPFVDRSGISQIGNNQTGSPNSASTANNTKSTAQTNVKTVASSPAEKPTVQNTGGKTQTGGVKTTTEAVVKEDTGIRIARRDENIRNGIPVGPESEIFAIEDLLPVGVVTGGNGQDEILLYSQTADRTYSYPVGTKFFDGWLAGIRSEGGVFGFVGTNETRLKSWVRSIQPRSATN